VGGGLTVYQGKKDQYHGKRRKIDIFLKGKRGGNTGKRISQTLGTPTHGGLRGEDIYEVWEKLWGLAG